MKRLKARRQGAVVFRMKHVAAAVAIAMGAPVLVHGQEAIEEVKITGSRITQSGMNAPTPVTAVSVEELSEMAPGSVIESLTQLPQFYGNIASEQIVGGQNSGAATVNLSDKDGGTLLAYNVDAQIGGKLAQLGQRLINGAAKKMADEFFQKFAAAVGSG